MGFVFEADDGFFGGIADFADELKAHFAFCDALGREEFPVFRFVPFPGSGDVAGGALIEEGQALAHLGRVIPWRVIMLIAEHQVQDVGGGGGGGERWPRVMVLLQAILDGFLCLLYTSDAAEKRIV